MSIEYILIGAGITLGALIGFFIAYYQSKTVTSALKATNSELGKQKEDFESKYREEADRAIELEKKLIAVESDYRNLKERYESERETLKTEFKNLANEILETNSKKLSEQNKEKLDLILNPLGEKLDEFKQRVEQTHTAQTKETASLKEQIKQMAELNQKMSDDAKNLTKALKGDNKAQGNWGEVILLRILEKSGLTKGREYNIQESSTTDDGRRLQPDVVINLPDDKFLIVDSKVSLTAYEKIVSADDEKEAEQIVKQHITSIRAHVKGLSDKNYQLIHGDKSPDFVLLFIPIEPAFALALQNDNDLYYEAFEKNIVIVSPSTLLATLGTIQSVWKQEYQNKNAQEIAQRGGALYDKFVNFVDSMSEIGQRIHQTQISYDEAMNRLRSGRGNLVRQAEMMKELGVQSTKKLSISSGSDSLEEED